MDRHRLMAYSRIKNWDRFFAVRLSVVILPALKFIKFYVELGKLEEWTLYWVLDWDMWETGWLPFGPVGIGKMGNR